MTLVTFQLQKEKCAVQTRAFNNSYGIALVGCAHNGEGLNGTCNVVIVKVRVV